jgi:O-antigen/teichoic acid export membrane protein
LKFLVDDVAVGVYSVAYKITFAFQFIPLAFVAALYPAFSYYWKHDHDALKTSFLKGVEYLLIIALPVAFGIAALAFDLIPLIYTSEFQASILPLIVLMLSLPFLFINFPVGSLLNACHRQTRQMIHLGITMVLNVTLNLVLIPLYGPLGAAIASTLSTIFIFALGVYVAYRIINVHLVKLMAMLVKLFAIALVMAVLVIVLKQHIPWYVAIVPGALLYIGSLYVFRIVSFREVLRLRSLFTR